MKRGKKLQLKPISSVTILLISAILTLGIILAANSSDLHQIPAELNGIIEKIANLGIVNNNNFLTSAVVFAANLVDLDPVPTELTPIIDQVVEIEIWANTYIHFEIMNTDFNAVLTLDNGTVLSEQEIEFYLNESLISTSITDLEGYASFPLNETSPGNYSLKTIFQGNPSLYSNPSSEENIIEILDENGSVVVRFADEAGIPEITIPENLTWNLTDDLVGNLTGNLTANQTETNVTPPLFINETLLTLFTVYTDKETYLPNERINIYGEAIIEGLRVNSDASLEIIFNGSTIFYSDIKVTNGSYSSSLQRKFVSEGDYLVRVILGELSAETSFKRDINNPKEISIEGISCEEFKERILWSSGYSNDLEGSVNYQTWEPQHDCAEIGKPNCFLGNVEVKTRFLYFGENNNPREGYIQISDPDESICGNPEQGTYSKYLAYEKLRGESQNLKLKQHCGNNRNPNGKCGIDLTESFENPVECYGIKSWADAHLIVDAFEVKYTLCGNEQ